MKKIDWENTYSDPVRRKLGQGKYTSGREFVEKAFEQEQVRQEAEEVLVKSLPVMQALLKTRLANKTPLTVMRTLSYMSSELQKSMDRNGEATGGRFVDVRRQIYPGKKLILKSLDHNLQEFIFVDENGTEVVLPYSAQKELMISTNIYEDVKAFMNNNRGE